MSPSKPLSYGPLKSVLAHINAVKRFEISQKMPTIQKTEKLVPLKIDKFAFSYLEFTVNETMYDIRRTQNTSKSMPCFQDYICLFINGIAREYLEYSPAQYQHSSEHLMSLFFGGRSDPILVKHFSFINYEWLTWPQNAKLQIQHLTVKNGIRKALTKLSAVLTNSSFPLESLKIFVDDSTAEEFRDEVVQEARKVEIVHGSSSTFTIGPENWNFLPANIHFESTKLLPDDSIMAVIRNWRTSEAAPGRRCSVGLSNDREDKCFDFVKENGVITIPINHTSELRVAVKDRDGSQYIKCRPTSMLVLEVVAKM